MKPLIGLTPTPRIDKQKHGTFRLYTLNDHYSKALEAGGGLAMVLPTHQTDIPALLDRLDGIIITGGGDIDPANYGQEPHAKTDEVDAERDTFEIALVREAVRRNIPLLGICRGIQVINVALGGSLVQDIPSLQPKAVDHRQQDHKIPHDTRWQQARVSAGDHPLQNTHADGSIAINTFHHQGIDTLAPDLTAIAHAEDDLIEAVYHPGMTFGLAVQWHPELLAQSHEEHARIFAQFVGAARQYRAAL